MRLSKTLLSLLFSALAFICYAQTSVITYYKNGKEVAPEKANLSKTVTNHEDGKITTELKDLKKGKIISRQTYKGNEPFGIWIEGDLELNFDFEIIYTDTGCHDLPDPKIKDPFIDNDSIGYVSPKIKSGEPFLKYLTHNLQYPAYAKENGIQGRVVMVFIIDHEGKIQRLAVSEKSKHVTLDKEAMRVLREIQFSNLPIFNGVTQHFCFVLPLSFKLE
jgi:TonB family protein